MSLKKWWNINAEMKLLGDTENNVYLATNSEGQERIVRMTSPTHRQLSELQAELNWLSSLKRNGLRVASPILSNEGELVHQFHYEQKPYFVSVFTKASGRFLHAQEDLIPENFKKWGAYIGQMHKLTKNYFVPNEMPKRKLWFNDDGPTLAFQALDPFDHKMYELFTRTVDEMRSLPKNHNNFGLIHADLHGGNFVMDHDGITAFDFDDSCYHWFVYDIAVPIYHMMSKPNKTEITPYFLEGYSQQNSLAQNDIDMIPLFLKYRKSMIYHWVKQCIANGRWRKEKEIEVQKFLNRIRES